MSVSERFLSSRLFASTLLSLLLAGAGAFPAPAQQVLIGQADSVRVTNGGVWHLQGGTMDLGGVDTTAALVETDSARVTGGTLTATRALNGPSSANPAGLGAFLSASADLGEVTVTRGHAVQTGGGNESIERYYDIDPSGTNSGLNADLKIEYRDAELGTISDESNLVFFKSDDGGTSWAEKGITSQDETANTATLQGISSFSRWTLGSSTSPLPVEMAAFEAARAGKGTEEAVRLRWQTASESGNAGFEVQRKAAGSSVTKWQTVGFRESKAEGGSASEALAYRFVDEDLPYAADTLKYRLRQVDLDGSAEVTDPVRVARGGVTELRLKKTYPNPARSRVTVRFAVPETTAEGEARLQLYDILGRQVRSAPTEAGRHKRQLSVRDLASGVYVLRLEAGETSQTRRLTVVK
ncbi:hypothetical protein BSZ35_18255 [Salinibacter sp. 10B]|uniref:T9SS type A sorting domain-containing protein n=1 Tax=Salinibacter sp. 10B TaxID=1923971 RepID=UPI000CF3A114|nr:T9SS type A sorting domain-containing protein [Salinibacter sp. 10B]PQJ26873.1 hypothetical protein BSZ35_18255 [Salinibacter sp. 10B]